MPRTLVRPAPPNAGPETYRDSECEPAYERAEPRDVESESDEEACTDGGHGGHGVDSDAERRARRSFADGVGRELRDRLGGLNLSLPAARGVEAPAGEPTNGRGGDRRIGSALRAMDAGI